MARRLGKPLMPWQQHVVDVALEVDPETGELFYEEVVITVPRQSGKTTLILALMVWRCVHMARRLDDMQVVTYLAQSGKMARRKLEREFIPKMNKARGFCRVAHSRAQPVKPTDWKPSLNNGSEHILFGTGSFLQIEAPTGTGSHGDVLDMPVIDEAFARPDDLVEQAVDAATVTRRSPQTYVISTAGNRVSTFLWRKVLAGRRMVTEGRRERTAYFEWSLPDDADYTGPTVWAQYLPALGHTITVRRLQSRLAKAQANPDEVDPDGYEPGLPGFLRGYMNRWMDIPPLGGEVEEPSEISAEEWMDPQLVDSGSSIVGDLVVGVGVAKDGISASVVVAGRRADGVPHVETLERASGVWWIERYVREVMVSHGAVAVAWDNGGPTRVIAPDLTRAAGGKDNIRPLSGREWSGACEAFKLAVAGGRLRHLGDLFLLDAVQGSRRRVTGDGWVWDMSAAQADITPLTAATAALRALEAIPERVEEEESEVNLW